MINDEWLVIFSVVKFVIKIQLAFHYLLYLPAAITTFLPVQVEIYAFKRLKNCTFLYILSRQIYHLRESSSKGKNHEIE